MPLALMSLAALPHLSDWWNSFDLTVQIFYIFKHLSKDFHISFVNHTGSNKSKIYFFHSSIKR